MLSRPLARSEPVELIYQSIRRSPGSRYYDPAKLHAFLLKRIIKPCLLACTRKLEATLYKLVALRLSQFSPNSWKCRERNYRLICEKSS